MTKLQEYREDIDRIDTQIVRLFEERMKVSEAVAGYKIEKGMQVLDQDREREKILSVTQKALNDFDRQGVRELFTQIMAISRKRQYAVLTENGIGCEFGFSVIPSLKTAGSRVVFQGVEGAYSHVAMREYFGEEVSAYHVRSWREAMEEVRQQKADYAVLPIENSTAGIVADIFDLLMEYDLYIVGEQVIRIDHVLLGLPQAELADIRRVVSHPQGLAQCREYLEAHPQWTTIMETNTARSAQKVSEEKDPGFAAIASREAGKLYGLKVLADGLCTNRDNSTRFVIVSAARVHVADAAKVSICFELPHRAGALYNMLSHIIYNGLNMTHIESRPIPGRNWEYRFFVDFEGNLKDSAVINALRGIQAEANVLRILGNYTRDHKDCPV